MKAEKIIYHGNARVYLQGKGALQLIDKRDSQCFTYFVGSIESAIRIHDYRQEPIEAAEATIEGRSEREFADVFNRPAHIEIKGCGENVEIEMRPGDGDETSPILWMGVIYDGKMPVHRIVWETLKPINDDAVAFAILASD